MITQSREPRGGRHGAGGFSEWCTHGGTQTNEPNGGMSAIETPGNIFERLREVHSSGVGLQSPLSLREVETLEEERNYLAPIPYIISSEASQSQNPSQYHHHSVHLSSVNCSVENKTILRCLQICISLASSLCLYLWLALQLRLQSMTLCMETIHSSYIFTLDSRLANMRAIARGPKNETHIGILIIKSWKKLGAKITLSTKLYLQLG